MVQILTKDGQNCRLKNGRIKIFKKVFMASFEGVGDVFLVSKIVDIRSSLKLWI